MRSPLGYAEMQDRRRTRESVGITVLVYVAILAAGTLTGLFNPSKDLYSNKTVIVNLAGLEAAEPGLGSVVADLDAEPQPEPPAAAKAATSSPRVESTTQAKAETKIPIPESAPKTAKPAAAASVPAAPAPEKSVPMPETTASETVSSSLPVEAETPSAPVEEAWVPGTRGPGSRISSTSSSVLVPGQGEIPWSAGTSLTIRKAEKGNSMETTLGAASGTVGQSLYVPIYLSLPLPREIPAYVYDRIPPLVVPPKTVLYTAQARQKAFRNYYEVSGGLWRLKSEVPADQREPLWQMLEDAGYDPSSADYKAGKNLSPVVIGFTVTKDKQLKGVEILQSSGDPAIDQAVLHGFKRASFWNKTGDTVPGRFTYRF